MDTASVSAAFQIFGLFMEVVGAILLLGEYVTRFQRIRRFGPPRGVVDIPLEDQDARDQRWLLAMPGVLILASGFTLQMAGLALQASRSWAFVGVIVGATVVTVAMLLHIVIRAGTSQPYSEIFRFITSNYRGVLTVKSRHLRCDGCHRRIAEADCEAWWITQGKWATYLRVGHHDCLGEDEVYRRKYPDPRLEKDLQQSPLAKAREQGLGRPLRDDLQSWQRAKQAGIPFVPWPPDALKPEAR